VAATVVIARAEEFGKRFEPWLARALADHFAHGFVLLSKLPDILQKPRFSLGESLRAEKADSDEFSERWRNGGERPRRSARPSIRRLASRLVEMKRGESRLGGDRAQARPAILIAVEDGWVTVVCGTSTAGRDYRCLHWSEFGCRQGSRSVEPNVLLREQRAASARRRGRHKGAHARPRVFFELEEKLRLKKLGL